MFNDAPIDQDNPQGAASAAPTPNGYQKEADALETALGLKSINVEIRDGVAISLREFEVNDLASLYNWLGELKANGAKLRGSKLDDAARQKLMDMALNQGVDLLYICSDGKIPKGQRLPLSVAARLVEGLIEVNTDFFTAWPTLQGLMMDLGSLLGTNAPAMPESTEQQKNPSIPSDDGQKSSDS